MGLITKITNNFKNIKAIEKHASEVSREAEYRTKGGDFAPYVNSVGAYVKTYVKDLFVGPPPAEKI